MKRVGHETGAVEGAEPGKTTKNNDETEVAEAETTARGSEEARLPALISMILVEGYVVSSGEHCIGTKGVGACTGNDRAELVMEHG